MRRYVGNRRSPPAFREHENHVAPAPTDPQESENRIGEAKDVQAAAELVDNHKQDGDAADTIQYEKMYPPTGHAVRSEWPLRAVHDASRCIRRVPIAWLPVVGPMPIRVIAGRLAGMDRQRE
jgi:hypothetical protein